jgi:hypothetical protein
MASGREVTSLAAEFWDFLRQRKKWWLAPIVIVLALFGALIVFTQGRPWLRSSTPSSRCQLPRNTSLAGRVAPFRLHGRRRVSALAPSAGGAATPFRR